MRQSPESVRFPHHHSRISRNEIALLGRHPMRRMPHLPYTASGPRVPLPEQGDRQDRWELGVHIGLELLDAVRECQQSGKFKSNILDTCSAVIEAAAQGNNGIAVGFFRVLEMALERYVREHDHDIEALGDCWVSDIAAGRLELAGRRQ